MCKLFAVCAVIMVSRTVSGKRGSCWIVSLNTNDRTVEMTVVRLEQQLHVQVETVQSIRVVDIADRADVLSNLLIVAHDNALDALEQSEDPLESRICRNLPVRRLLGLQEAATEIEEVNAIAAEAETPLVIVLRWILQLHIVIPIALPFFQSLAETFLLHVSRCCGVHFRAVMIGWGTVSAVGCAQ